MSQDISQYPPMNPVFQLSSEVVADNQSLVVVEPLEQGYGHTLGNALRRVLLSSLPGHAITKMRVEGADHQYSTVEGMTEDVLDVSLNIKQLRIKSESTEPGTLRLSVTGPANVTAAQIECDGGYSIINTDQHIATLQKGAKLEIEMIAEPGLGYVVSDEKKANAIGDIVLDALFSPIVKVSYTVDQTRVGRRTDYDKLVLDVQTDGTIEPVEAVTQAARILTKQFAQVYNPVIVTEEVPVEELSPEEAEVLRLTVEELDLPTRIANALRKGGFKTVGDLVGAEKDIVARVKNLGEKSVDVINEALQKKGVKLGA
jgi:DNA-directed RNA polymerase subunit alpha